MRVFERAFGSIEQSRRKRQRNHSGNPILNPRGCECECAYVPSWKRSAAEAVKATARNKCFNPTARSSAVRLRGRSLLTGKKTGNLADSGVFAKVSTENMCEFSSLQDEFPALSNR